MSSCYYYVNRSVNYETWIKELTQLASERHLAASAAAANQHLVIDAKLSASDCFRAVLSTRIIATD